jgi:leucyl/phenylalanyl-tRNA--protein transferase
MIPWLESNTPFPPLATALIDPNGLLAAGADLSPERLIAAYHRGIFPWFSPGQPILWWSPDPRMVLAPSALKISRALAKTLRHANYAVRLDTTFDQVISACAGTPRHGQSGTWITAEMIAAYQQLHRLGIAHSVDTWHDGKLVGGLYGIALGRAFFGESMFSHRTDASKIALAHLCAFLDARGFGIIDCQMETPHLTSLGAGLISRNRFIATVQGLLNTGKAPGLWPALAIDGYFKVSP